MKSRSCPVGLSAMLLLVSAVTGCSDDSGASNQCAGAAPEALRICLAEVSEATGACYSNTNAPCVADDTDIAGAISTLEQSVRDGCDDGQFGLLTVDSLVGRLRNSCSSEASSLGWRTYGGPQGAVWPTVDAASQSCLQTAHTAAAAMIDSALAAINACLADGDCSSIDAERQALVDTAVSEVEGACTALEEMIAVNPATYIDRAVQQVDCITATGHADTGSLSLACGPSNADFEAPRGEYLQVVVDGEKWGTLCGDRSPYAFQVRLAPEGERLDRIIVGLQGGGVCAFEADCVPRFEGRLTADNNLFNAMDDEPLSVGIASNDPAESPFANWTKVYLPYCNQEVFAGGGVTETLGELELPRYGAVNLRAAVQMVRDVIWKLMDAEGSDGFRPDEIIALFGGWSAGGYGTLYNYHWVLDDLQWPHTAAFPDSALALDNVYDDFWSLRNLSTFVLAGGAPFNWAAQATQPPYCFGPDCVVGPDLLMAHAPRLKAVPEQQYMIVSNQNDEDGQMVTSFFDRNTTFEQGRVNWINEARKAFCDTKDLNGIHYFFMPFSQTLHSTTMTNYYMSQVAVAGQTMNDWMADAFSNSDGVADRVEEGTLTEDYPGVNPFPCALPTGNGGSGGTGGMPE